MVGLRSRMIRSFIAMEAQTIRQRPKGKYRQMQPGKEMREKLNLVSVSLKQCPQRSGCVATKMSCRNIFLRPKPSPSRHGAVDPSSAAKDPGDVREKHVGVFDVFHNVEDPDGINRAGREICVFECGLDNIAKAAANRIHRTGTRFNQHSGVACSLHGQADEPFPPPMSKIGPDGGKRLIAATIASFRCRNQ